MFEKIFIGIIRLCEIISQLLSSLFEVVDDPFLIIDNLLDFIIETFAK